MINSRFKENFINKIYKLAKSLSPVGNSIRHVAELGRGGWVAKYSKSSFPMTKYVFPYIEIKQLCTGLQIDVHELCNSECVSYVLP